MSPAHPSLWGPLGTAPCSSAGLQPSVAPCRDCTYRVVSWLILVKEELLRELILLLLRSLEKRNHRAWSQLGPVPHRCSPACSAAMGCEQQHGTASKGAAGLSHRLMAAMPLSPLCPMSSDSRGCQHPGAAHHCQPAVSRCRGWMQRNAGGPCILPGPSSGSCTTGTASVLAQRSQQWDWLPGLLLLATYTSCRYLKVESCPGT